MASFDDLKKASFGVLEFPWQEISIRGGLRDHVHEFPHSPGGKPEKLGRKLYEIEFSGIVMDRMLDPRWTGVWPTRLGALRKRFEQQSTDSLHIPTIGTIKAYAFEWGQTANASLRSGEKYSFKFREDQIEAFLIENLIKASPRALSQRQTALFEEAEKRGINPFEVFDKLQNAVNGVLAVFDQLALGFALFEAKILQLENICRDLDRSLSLLDDPANHKILEALKALWSSALDLKENVQQKTLPLRQFVTPIEMGITEVSIAIFGDSTKGTDILKLNAFSDAFAIPSGTTVRYYEEAA